MNIYYGDSEDWGLELVGMLSLDNEPYQFYILAVWADPKTGEFYVATDSGCSCPVPFEDITSRNDLTLLGSNPHDVVKYVKQADNGVDDLQLMVSKIMGWKRAD